MVELCRVLGGEDGFVFVERYWLDVEVGKKNGEGFLK